MPTFGSGQFRYEVVDNWAKRPKGWTFTDVVGVAVDSRDNVYVFNRSAHPVMVFDKEGAFIRSWGEGMFARPHGIFVDGHDHVWCSDDQGHAVRKFDTSGNILFTLGTPGVRSDTGYDGRDLWSVKRAGPPFNAPTKAITTPSGDIFVSDGYGNARVHKFSADGKLLKSWGEPGRGSGQFVLPHSVLVDKQGLVYIADRQNNRLQVFDSQGAFVRVWTGLELPTDMVLDAQGHLYVAELTHAVSVWDLDGTLLTRWGAKEGASNDAGLFINPHGITRDSRGVLYVGEVCETGSSFDRGSRAVQKFVPAG